MAPVFNSLLKSHNSLAKQFYILGCEQSVCTGEAVKDSFNRCKDQWENLK